MDQRTRPAPRLAPLPESHTPELKDQFEIGRKRLGFVPNSMLIMQRKPAMVKGFNALASAIWDPQGTVPFGFRRLIAHVVSRSNGCQYCMAHTGGGIFDMGIEQQKFDAVWDYQTSPLFTPAERAALDVAVGAGTAPNSVTDEMFLELRKHWSEEQIVEIVGVIAMMGFLNRWNDTFATPLEDTPTAFGEQNLTKHGWSVGKHGR